MGTDKALLRVGGEAMAVRVATALRDAGARDVVCVGGDASALSAIGLSVIPDVHPGEGPLGGILTALAWAEREMLVVSPCDLVMPTPSSFTGFTAGERTPTSSTSCWAPVAIILIKPRFRIEPSTTRI